MATKRSKKTQAYPVFKKHKAALGRKQPPRGWISMVARDIATRVKTNESSAYDHVKFFLKGGKV
jgi:hypothetical protein